ncbi:MAG: Na/Pi cotransporter family protein [Lachnospiraceae bacterium]|nr:Na/Pi cotransporter family protein [Lachnospiraceae bacterium]
MTIGQLVEDMILLCGGLGLFLLGMKMMSESIEKSAGDKLRKILEFFTKNKFAGIIVGIVFTGIVQSSSACTVMVVSFVNSGLMNLYQAVGVIFGANIGTTVTSQLISFNLSKYAPLFLLLGVIMIMFFKKEAVVKFGDVLVGFGVLFQGLSLMSQSMEGLKGSPQIAELFASLTNPFLAVLVGFIVTSIIQSSSVTVSIVLLLAQQGLLNLPICLFIILGCNMGSCVTALIASLAGMKDAKRAAMIHFLFNLVGSVVVFLILILAGTPIINLILNLSHDDPGRFVANSHTIIKVFQVIILLPFTNLLVKATYLVVPGKDEKVGYRDNFQLQHIGDKVVFNPATAVVEVVNEIERMASLSSDNLNRAMNALVTLDDEDIQEVYRVEENINFLSHSITDYLVKINQTTLPIEDLKSIGALFHVVNDIERIGDHAVNVADAAKLRKERDVKFSQQSFDELAKMMELINKNMYYAIEVFAHHGEQYLKEVDALEEQVDQMEEAIQIAHVQRMSRNECTPQAGMLFSDIVSGLERVSDHATNVAYAMTKEKYKEGFKENY